MDKNPKPKKNKNKRQSLADLLCVFVFSARPVGWNAQLKRENNLLSSL